MIRAKEAREKVENFSKNSYIAFSNYLEDQNRGDMLSNAILNRAKDGYSSYGFRVPRYYHAAIEPYFKGLGYRVVVVPNITDDALIDVDIFW